MLIVAGSRPGQVIPKTVIKLVQYAWHTGIRVEVWQCNLTVKGWLVDGTVSGDMHYKDSIIEPWSGISLSATKKH